MSEPAAKQRQMINLDEFERRLGRPAAPAKNGEDPLAELARLVGNTEDRFNGLFPPRPTAAPNRAEPRFDVNDRQGPPLPGQKLGGDFSAIEAALRGSITPDFRAAPEQKRLVPEPKYPVAQPKYPAPQPQEEPVFEAQEHALEDEDWLDSPYDSTFVPGPDFAAGPEPEYVVEPARSRLPLYATAAVIVLGLVGIGASFTLKHHTAAPHEIAMIKAAPGPTKIQASDASDTSKPNQDVSLLDKTPQPAPTTVVNHTEEPVDLSSPQAAPQASPAQVEGGAAVVPVPPPPAVEAASAQSFGVSGMIEPRKVKTVAVRPDGTIVSGDAPP
ncbi:MAG TPA: hypothetical protein VKV77_08320, partial [Methylovirgula sp.]|nr:hypothetical protein [Methylovirgula sp.]